MRFQKGHTMTPEMRLKISQKLKGVKKSPETIAKMSISGKLNNSKRTPAGIAKQAAALKGKKASLETRIKMSLAQSGNKSNTWKGGITHLYLQIRNNFKMRQWTSDCFHRDDFTCQDCGMKGGKLHCHHIKHFADIIKEYNIKTLEEALDCEELWGINNGMTLCDKCHILKHKKNGKSL
jgi:hypothetical protein